MPDTYFFEWFRLGHLWRVEMQIPGAPLSDADRIFYEIPSDVLVAFGDVDMGFEKTLIGLQTTGVLKLRVDLAALDRTEELRALRAALLQPTLRNAGTIDLGSGESRDFDTAVMWTFCCDFGAGYASGSNSLRNSVVIQCQQRPLPSLRHKVSRAATSRRRAIVDLTLMDVFRAAIETVSPDDISRRVQNLHAPVGPHSYAYDLIYRHASANYVRVESEPGPVKLRRYFYPLYLLYTELEQCAIYVYQAITRSTSARLHLYSVLHNGGEIGGTPYDHWEFARWDYTINAIPVWGFSADDVYICGKAFLSDSESSTDPDELVSGVLVRQGNSESQQSIYRFRTAYDFLRVSCEAAGVKGIVTQTHVLQEARREVTCWFRPVLSGATTPRVIATSAFEGQDVDIDNPSSLITRAKVAIPGLEGDDKSEYDSSVYWGRGIEDEEDENLRALFHNCPRIGDDKNVYPTGRNLTGDLSGVEEIPEVSGTYAGVMSKGLVPWKLYYIERPQLTGTYLTTHSVPIRVHCTASMMWGEGLGEKAFGGFISTTLPILASSSALAIDQWWDELFGVYVDMYDNATMPIVLAETMAAVFGNPLQVGYPDFTLRMSASTIKPNDIGNLVQIGDDGTASVFLGPSETFYDHLSTVVFATSITMSIRTGAAKVNFLHVEKP